MKSLSTVQLLQAAAGIATAGPMLLIGVELVRVGEVHYGILFFVAGLVLFVLPGYLIGKFVDRIGNPKRRIKEKLYGYLPSNPFK